MVHAQSGPPVRKVAPCFVAIGCQFEGIKRIYEHVDVGILLHE